MRLLISNYDIELELEENKVTVISAESPRVYRDLLENLWKQANGEDGIFIFSEGTKRKNISKEVECIFNVFSIDINSKKVISKLYSELKEQSQTVLQEETSELYANLLEYFDKLLMTVPYNLQFDISTEITSLLKIFNVAVINQNDDILEKIIEYIKALNKICSINVFVFIDLKHYLSEEELRMFYEFVFYEKIQIIIVEPVHTPKLTEEKCCIIDKDLCIINL